MATHTMRLPDLGEGTVSAEVIAWRVRVGDRVIEDAPLVEMATDKAVVEVPSPVTGRVVSITGNPGDSVAVGAELAVFEIDDASVESVSQAATLVSTTTKTAVAPVIKEIELEPLPAGKALSRVRASPATRRRAFEAANRLTMRARG